MTTYFDRFGTGLYHMSLIKIVLQGILMSFLKLDSLKGPKMYIRKKCFTEEMKKSHSGLPRHESE